MLKIVVSIAAYQKLLPLLSPFIPFYVEHIIAQQHVSDDSLENLVLACDRCNAYKGPNIASIDPDTRAAVELFHPRRDVWTVHFRHKNGLIVGLTPKGRATARLLTMNALHRIELRREWIGLIRD